MDAAFAAMVAGAAIAAIVWYHRRPVPALERALVYAAIGLAVVASIAFLVAYRAFLLKYNAGRFPKPHRGPEYVTFRNPVPSLPTDYWLLDTFFGLWRDRPYGTDRWRYGLPDVYQVKVKEWASQWRRPLAGHGRRLDVRHPPPTGGAAGVAGPVREPP